MVVPDFELICEIMLVAEGFLDARLLARKFITLYTLCRELLSKQDHYDWGLRAIKSVLVVAGALKRSDPDRPEDQVIFLHYVSLLITLPYSSIYLSTHLSTRISLHTLHICLHILLHIISNAFIH